MSKLDISYFLWQKSCFNFIPQGYVIRIWFGIYLLNEWVVVFAHDFQPSMICKHWFLSLFFISKIIVVSIYRFFQKKNQPWFSSVGISFSNCLYKKNVELDFSFQRSQLFFPSRWGNPLEQIPDPVGYFMCVCASVRPLQKLKNTLCDDPISSLGVSQTFVCDQNFAMFL